MRAKRKDVLMETNDKARVISKENRNSNEKVGQRLEKLNITSRMSRDRMKTKGLADIWRSVMRNPTKRGDIKVIKTINMVKYLRE